MCPVRASARARRVGGRGKRLIRPVGSTEEATITINEFGLTNAQAMTVRVALEVYAISLREDGLGDNDLGRQMTRTYLDRISEIRSFIFRSESP